MMGAESQAPGWVQAFVFAQFSRALWSIAQILRHLWKRLPERDVMPDLCQAASEPLLGLSPKCAEGGLVGVTGRLDNSVREIRRRIFTRRLKSVYVGNENLAGCSFDLAPWRGSQDWLPRRGLAAGGSV